jgi:hypothetical protein
MRHGFPRRNRRAAARRSSQTFKSFAGKRNRKIGGKGTIRSICASSPRPTAISRRKFKPDASAPICITGSARSNCLCPPCASGAKTSNRSRFTSPAKYAAKFSRRIERVSSRYAPELYAYDFPGNIRELEHIVEHAVHFLEKRKLILPRPLAENRETNQVSSQRSAKLNRPLESSQTLSSIEREHIIEVLRQTSDESKANEARRKFGLNPATVYFGEKLGIER